MRYPITCTAACLLLALAAPLHAAPAATQEAGEDSVNDGTSKEEIARHLQEIEKRFGKDAVAMQGSLLGEASRNGSIYDAEISIAGVEERGGKRFLTFRLQSGIVYNDRDTSPLARRQNAWGSIVEKTLRQFRTLTVPADGVAILLAYHHTTFSDAARLREQQAAPPGEAETLAFYVLAADVAELTAERITSQQLLDRSTVLLDGAPFHLVPAPPAPTPMPGPDNSQTSPPRRMNSRLELHQAWPERSRRVRLRGLHPSPTDCKQSAQADFALLVAATSVARLRTAQSL